MAAALRAALSVSTAEGPFSGTSGTRRAKIPARLHMPGLLGHARRVFLSIASLGSEQDFRLFSPSWKALHRGHTRGPTSTFLEVAPSLTAVKESSDVIKNVAEAFESIWSRAIPHDRYTT